MNRRVINHIISLLLLFAFMLPVFFQRNGQTPAVLNGRTVFLTLVRGIPILAVLLILTLTVSVPERKKWGWNTPSFKDAVWGILLFSATVFIGFVLPEVPKAYLMEITSGWKPVLIPLLALYSAASEEIFFRSWLLVNLEELAGKSWPGMLVSAFLFGIMHIWQGYWAAAFAFVAALMYGTVFQRRRNLYPLIAAHTAHNILALALAPRL
jgi:membrane protease YdiL (CAAX protease family)